MDVVEPAGPPEKERPTLHALVKGFSQHVRNVARYWRVPSRDVEDVTQEAFLRVHRALSRYRPRAEGPQPWLTKITIRAAQNYLQRHALQETLTTDDATMEEAMDQTPNAEEQARFAEAARIACAIMRGLPEALREVYQLHLDGADERYIAELTHLPLTTVHKRLHHARVKVEAAIAELHRNEERRRGAASAMLPLLDSPQTLFAAAGKAPPVPGLEERVLAYLAKTVGLACAGALVSLSALHVAGLGAALFAFGAGIGATITHAAQPEAKTTIVVSEPACPTSMTGGALALTTATAAPAEPHERSPARGPSTVASARPEQPRWIQADRSAIEAAISALNIGDAQAAKTLLVEHARLYPTSQLKSLREELLHQANIVLDDPHEAETP